MGAPGLFQAHRPLPIRKPTPYNSKLAIFFFSSRRRHTSLTCDWSSDVCSSDLKRINLPPRQVARRVTRQLKRPVLRPSCTRRSEERRVGKECRSRWSAYHEQKKGGKRAGNRGTVLEGRRGGEGRPEHETT